MLSLEGVRPPWDYFDVGGTSRLSFNASCLHFLKHRHKEDLQIWTFTSVVQLPSRPSLLPFHFPANSTVKHRFLLAVSDFYEVLTCIEIKQERKKGFLWD
jgi:hypothetical protein